MKTTSGSRAAMLALATALLLTLRAPLTEAAPDPAAWGEASGYNAVEANRTASFALLAPDPGIAAQALRVQRARAALASGELGGMQEEALARLVASAPEEPEADVLYAIEANRAMAAEAALASGELGGMQEEALTQVAAAAAADSTGERITPGGRIR